jgi:hypothetical protein
LKGSLKAANKEWRKIPLETFQNALRSWPKQILAIYKAQSRHAVMICLQSPLSRIPTSCFPVTTYINYNVQ